MRTSRKELESLAAHIGRLLNKPEANWRRDADGLKEALIGSLFIESAMGAGYSLMEIVSDSGACTPILRGSTKRDLADQMRAYIAGIEAGRAK